MLPLALYFSDEFRLLDRRTLQRAFNHYCLLSDQAIESQLSELFADLGYQEPAQLYEAQTPGTMLHEPITTAEADRNFNHYLRQIDQLELGQPLIVSTLHLHPRFHPLYFERTRKEMIKRLIPLISAASNRQLRLVLGAVPESHLGIQLQLFEALLAEESVFTLGITVSAASKRCLATIALVEQIAVQLNKRVVVRLINSQNLEAEVLQAQRDAITEYPVLRDTRLIADQYRLACLFFASQNCKQINPILVDAEGIDGIDLPSTWGREQSSARAALERHFISAPAPMLLYQGTRARAPGVLWGCSDLHSEIRTEIDKLSQRKLLARPVIAGVQLETTQQVNCYSPVDVDQLIGERGIPDKEQVRQALDTVDKAIPGWDRLSAARRAEQLNHFALQLIERRTEVAAILAYETGKPITQAIEEVRDAADLAYYYTSIAVDELAPVVLYRDEYAEHTVELHGRGLFVAMPSPEQPVAELVGATVAALIAGNGVILKPAEDAALVSARIMELMLESQIPETIIALLPGGLREIGDCLLEDHRVNGITYTGLGEQGSRISQQLALRAGSQLIPIIVNAEGQSLFIIDADQSAHQLIKPLMQHAFTSAGQYPLCSHVVYLEESIAERFEQQLIDALPLIHLGNPLDLATDLGPVASRYRLDALHQQIERLRARGRVMAEQPLSEQHHNGLFVPPTIIRLYTLDELQEVVPGPVLYIIRFNRDNIERVIPEINRTGYGLSLTLFSHDNALQKLIQAEVKVGNLNFNLSSPRGSAGALPIGGIGPSGTGPQIGGPNYLKHFVCERTLVRRFD